MEQYLKELEYKNHMLTTFIDNSEVGMYVIDYHTGEILYANRKMVAMGGNRVSVDKLIGTTCWKMMNVESDERCSYCPYTKLLNEDGTPTTPYIWENFFERFGMWLKVISQVIVWVDGRLAQMTTFYDITGTKEMQKQIARHARQEEQWKMQQSLQIVLDFLPVPIRILNIETATIIYINNKFMEMFKYNTKDQLIGKNVTMLLPPVSSNGIESQAIEREILRSHDIKNIEMEYVTSKGELFEARLTNCIIDFNGIKSAVGIITDLSVEKAQNRLLIQAAEHEREANRLKSNFLSNMSHEIRTPMNAIIGLTDVELRKGTSKEALGIYRKINSSAKNLLQIINDILDLSKIEADRIELYPDEFELEDVLNSALLVAASKLVGRKVELILDLSAEVPRFLFGDRTRLWQILRNHLDNAAKFTTEGNIVLTIEEDKEQSTAETVSISFTVEDTGSGMDEEQLSKIFLPYEQFYADMRMRDTGTGLGIPISKRLCELMGGTMSVESEMQKGTTMRFSIPFVRSLKEDKAVFLSYKKVLSGLSVLVIDDSQLLLKTVKKLLQGYGAECITAHSCNKGIELIRERKGKAPNFDIIIIDNYMEDINGIEAAKLINNGLSESSTLLVSVANENLVDKSQLLSSGVYDVIEKPFLPSQFMQKVKEALDDSQNNENESVESYMTFTGTRILVFEDNDVNQEVAAAMLNQFGIATVFACNGKKGIQMLDDGENVDLIFMDLHMPVMDGYEATRIIRLNPKYDKIPIISLTADAMSETIDKCLELGMNDFITKPMDFGYLYSVLKKWL